MIELPAGGVTSYRNVLTGGCACVRQIDGRAVVRAAEVLEHFPVAFLESR